MTPLPLYSSYYRITNTEGLQNIILSSGLKLKILSGLKDVLPLHKLTRPTSTFVVKKLHFLAKKSVDLLDFLEDRKTRSTIYSTVPFKGQSHEIKKKF